MRELEGERGHRARPFRLVITEIPVAGVICHRLAPDHLLISGRFRADEAACRAALRALLAELY
ncbi:hypothetical protein [Goodfellowiella coeruleoviolacea]|uniref:Uncharacterized protein n=1 Tax=Goodfellowiella coeruleoviolacea TaxID=334858 RepID=A0AAE3KIW9_9PSEU|nr:hypothetical protein [Goodfellowiella coeruleoviolacea]MCP2169686.1 hypothetical protein [Goodfellowiella coeruleoviolacea]